MAKTPSNLYVLPIILLVLGIPVGIVLTKDAGLGAFIGGGLGACLGLVLILIVDTIFAVGSCRSCGPANDARTGSCRSCGPSRPDVSEESAGFDGRQLAAAAGAILASAAAAVIVGHSRRRNRAGTSRLLP